MYNNYMYKLAADTEETPAGSRLGRITGQVAAGSLALLPAYAASKDVVNSNLDYFFRR